MQQIVTIRELRAEGLGLSAMARRLGIDRKTIRKYLAQEDFSPPAPSAPQERPSLLDPYKPVIQQGLDADRAVFHQQHHTAQRILERLREEYPECPGSYSTGQRSVKRLRAPGTGPGTLERVWHPGECQGSTSAPPKPPWRASRRRSNL